MSKPASCLLFAVAAVILAAIPLAAAVAQQSPDITRFNPRGSSGAIAGGDVISNPDGPPTDPSPRSATSSILTSSLCAAQPPVSAGAPRYHYCSGVTGVAYYCSHPEALAWTQYYWATGNAPRDANDQNGACVPKASFALSPTQSYWLNPPWVKKFADDGSIIPVDDACPDNPDAPIAFQNGRWAGALYLYDSVTLDPAWYDRF